MSKDNIEVNDDGIWVMSENPAKEAGKTGHLSWADVASHLSEFYNLESYSRNREFESDD